MIVTFQDLGITASEFNGETARYAYLSIVNKACQWIMDNFYPMDNECDIMPNVANTTIVNFTNDTVYIETVKPYTVH